MTLPIFKDKENDVIVKGIIEHIQRKQEYKLNIPNVGKFFPYREDNRFVELQHFDLHS
jgi:hypothetical protein